MSVFWCVRVGNRRAPTMPSNNSQPRPQAARGSAAKLLVETWRWCGRNWKKIVIGLLVLAIITLVIFAALYFVFPSNTAAFIFLILAGELRFEILEQETAYFESYLYVLSAVGLFLVNTGLIISIFLFIGYVLGKRMEVTMNLAQVFGLKETVVMRELAKKFGHDSEVNQAVEEAFETADQELADRVKNVVNDERLGNQIYQAYRTKEKEEVGQPTLNQGP